MSKQLPLVKNCRKQFNRIADRKLRTKARRELTRIIPDIARGRFYSTPYHSFATIESGFVWRETPQGEDFWATVKQAIN